jgi:hypothetical protein
LRTAFPARAVQILIHNTDDHLRNHGFFIDEGGIRLPPVPQRTGDPASGMLAWYFPMKWRSSGISQPVSAVCFRGWISIDHLRISS